MTLNYQKIWNVMNDLEMVATKICSAREILDSAIDKLEENQYDKAGTLLYAADEFLQYYLQEFDTKFKDAWKETVTKVKQQEIDDCEEGTDCITGEQEYYITFPDDLLEAANLKPGDDVEWVDRNDGSFLLRKTTQPKTYDEMVAAGYTMTADGFWIKE